MATIAKAAIFFIHKICGDKPSETIIQHKSHPAHPLLLRISKGSNNCDVCRRQIVNHFYRCETCDFDIDLYCARYTPPDVIDVPEMHHHKLTLFKEQIEFVCDAKCGRTDYEEFPYKCDECDITFHIDCVWFPSEAKHISKVNHSHHPWHSLKLVRRHLSDYSDGKCRLCGRTVDKLFYHCSSCNFALNMCCVLNPPPQSLLNLKAHDHQLSLLRGLCSFTCSACGLSGDRSPYICVQCDFMIHPDCLSLPSVIKINRHHHRIARTSILDVDVMNYVCGVCRQKLDWTCGGYSCEKCPGYVVHSKCATRKDVWNGKELGVPEEIEDLKPYVVINDNTIHHFSHEKHYLRLYVNGIIHEEDKHCDACTQPISLQSFYGCMDCDFILHQSCAEFPKKKWHMLHNDQLTLVTSHDKYFECDACDRLSNGFMYQHGERRLDVHCSSISEPFFHLSHPHHPLYYIPPKERRLCSGCNMRRWDVLTCIEEGCGSTLCFRCATLPQEIKHRVDDHPLSLCYGEKANGKYWCDICEKETNPEIWFYTCKDQRASVHVKCVFGDLAMFMPKTIINDGYVSYEVVLNNSVSRPFCTECKLRCIYPIMLKMLKYSDLYFCSWHCTYYF